MTPGTGPRREAVVRPAPQQLLGVTLALLLLMLLGGTLARLL
ncbi:hypothetical protein [Deinococcus sp.]|nr:hypothetical protein [Deinococcus sp.]